MKELVKIQGELKAPKNQVNKFGGYKYRSCEDILEAVKPLLTANKCSLIIGDGIEQIGDRYYVKAVAVLTNEEGETVETSAYAREPLDKKGMDAPQVTGTASSYARKYALNGLFAIDDTKDADTNEYKKQTDAATVPDLPDPELCLALDQVKQATSVEQLQKVWNELSGWQSNKTFIAEVNKRKKELQK